MPRTVLLVDDAAEIRGLLRVALELRGGFEVVGEAADGLSAVEHAARCQPDIVVLDLGLPGLAGADVVAGVRGAAPSAHVVVFTGLDNVDRLLERTGIAALVQKGGDIEYLLDVLTGLRATGEDAATIGIAAEHTEVAVARAFIRRQCEEWGLGAVSDQAALVVSELVTNAIVHAHSACELRASATGRVLRIEVIDDGDGDPDPQLPELDAEHGRGLMLVTALCAAWGVDAAPEGRKRVWAELVET